MIVKYLIILFKPILKLVGYCIYVSPKPMQNLVGNFFGFLWFDLFRIRRQLTIKQVQQAMPELSPKEAKQIARASVYNVGRTIAEFANLYYWSSSEFIENFNVEGEENLKQAMAKNKGVLFLTLHLGNGDLAAAKIARMGYPINLITKKFKSKWLDDLWNKVRTQHGLKLISDRRTQYEILSALKKNEIVTFVLDQYMGKPLGVKTNFFGIPTGTAMGLAIFHKKTMAPLIPVYTFREGNGKSRLVFRPEIPFEDFGDETISIMTQKYTDYLENIVREYPKQWMWVHRRWKKFQD